MKETLVLCVISFLFSFAASAHSFASTPRNFAQVTENIYRGARPDRYDLHDLVMDYEIFSDINLENDEDAVADERYIAQKLDLKYLSTPLSAKYEPDDEDIDRVLAQLQNPRNFPIFIHCKHGQDRTGLIIGLYRVEVQGWSPARAYREMLTNGFHPELTGLRNYFFSRVR